jgi:hypothetical protein
MANEKSWLDAMMESEAIQKKIQEFKHSLGPDYAPSLIFDFDHVMAAIGIVKPCCPVDDGA